MDAESSRRAISQVELDLWRYDAATPQSTQTKRVPAARAEQTSDAHE